MGSGLVSGLDADRGSDTSRSPLTYREIFEQNVPFYLSIGMTPEQYWDEDPKYAEWYRKAYELKNDRKNQELWLQGLYVYSAILDASPILHAFAKKGTKPREYFSEPIPITANAVREKREREAKAKMERIHNKMLRFMSAYNKEVKKDG